MWNDLFVENTPPTIAVSVVIVTLLVWRLKPRAFRILRWQAFGIASAIFWGVFAALIISFAWNFYYKLFMPAWYRYAAPLVAIFLYSALAVLFRGLALRIPGNPVVWFCVLGGLESIPEHAVGMYRFDILGIPLLAGSSALSIFIFAFFEYVIYWGCVMILAVGANRLIQVLRPSSLA